MSTQPPIADRTMPEPLVDQFSSLLTVAEPPATYVEWVDATVTTLDGADFTLDVNALCLTGESPHRVTIDGDVRHLRCVLDALLVPFVVGGSDPVEVQTRCPTTGADVEMAVSRDGVSATPPDAVVSFGIAAVPDLSVDSDTPADPETHPIQASERFCPYSNAFASESAYEAWDAGMTAAEAADAETAAVVTTALSVIDAFALAELLAEGLTDGGEEQ